MLSKVYSEDTLKPATVYKQDVFHKWGHSLGLQPDICSNSGYWIHILKKKFCKEQYMYIRTTGVLSTCFYNFFLSTERIDL